MSTGGPLADVRIVEWGERIAGPFAGLLLASLGADVIKLEPARGDVARRQGPFPPGHDADPAASALFHALNRGKRSVLEETTDESLSQRLDALLAQADIFLTSQPLARRAAEGLELADLCSQHRHLVGVSVSTFGDTGPLAGVPGNALTAAAYAGASIAIGLPNRPPLTLPLELGDYEAGINAAGAAIAALIHRDASGQGQVVDVAAVDVIASYVIANAQMYRPYGKPWAREGRRASRSGGAYPYGLFACRDGLVAMIGRTEQDWRRLLEMIGEPAWSQAPSFDDPFQVAEHHADQADVGLEAWLQDKTRAELVARARQAGFALGPVLSIAETLDEPHFRQRGVFAREIKIGGSAFNPPRLPWETQLSPSRWATATAPRAPVADLPDWRRRPEGNDTHRQRADANDSLPLSGIRVVDFSWVWSGPMVGATLADLGADVIKIEHGDRLDNARLRGRPIVDGKPVEGPAEEVSFYFRQNNRGKRSLAVDLKQAQGSELVRSLIAASDIVLENLTRGVFARVGLDLADLQRQHPGLIVISLSAAGSSGPLKDLRVYAPLMTALAGLESLVGYPDERELGMVNIAIGDPNAASFALVATLAALAERQRTGKGQVLDIAQIEAMLAPLSEAFAGLQLAGRDPRCLDDLHPLFVPHGHFPCRGEDRWIAISIASDRAWAELADVIGDPLRDERFASLAGRTKAAGELTAALSAHTRHWDRDQLVDTLIGRGVAAAPVHELEEVLDDRHLHERGLFAWLTHPVTGAHEAVRTPWNMSLTPPRARASAPLLGQDTDEILSDVLGLDGPRISALREIGVLR